jgi:methenyltetrahydromethanopterin cyclohydrolase
MTDPVPLPEIQELSQNRLALPLVQELIISQQKLNVSVQKQNGIHIIDCGINVPGGSEAGILFASICMGGLSQVHIHWAEFHGFRWPTVQVMTDHPLRACILSQFAGWPIRARNFFAMGSGPGRAVADFEELFRELGCSDSSETAIICLESSLLPSEEAVQQILRKCRCKPENLYILVAPTASAVGSVQIAARALETGLYKLKALSFDITCIQSGWAICPLPPVVKDSTSALGRTNDAIFYGSTVCYNVHHENDEYLAEIIKEVPSSASPEHGKSFVEILEQYQDLYEIDPLLFSPAEIWISNMKSGKTFHAGVVNPKLFFHSFGIHDGNIGLK